MFGKLSSIVAVVVVMALVLVTLPFPAGVAAQEVVSGSSTGVSVTFSADWSHEAAASQSTPTADSLVLTSGNTNFIVTRGQVDLEEATALLGMNGVVTNIDVTASYALRSVEANGVTYAVFSVVVGSDVQTVIAPDTTFAAAVASAQAGIQVDGVPVLAGVDGAALVPTGSSGDGAATAPALLGGGADAAESVATAAEEAPANTAATEAATVAVTVPEGTGFVDITTWVSPSFGTVVTWGDEWAPKITDTDPGFTSSPSGANDGLCLYSTDDALAKAYGSPPFLCINLSITDQFDTPERWQELYGDPAAVSGYGIPYFAVDITESGYVVANTAVDGSVGVLMQERLQDGTTVTVRVVGATDSLPDLFDRAQSDIGIDGQQPFSLIDAGTFQAAYDEKIATLPELNAQRDAELRTLGLVEPGHYQSVATGCDIAWDDSLRMFGSLSPVTGEIWAGSGVEALPGEQFSLTYRPTGRSIDISCFASPDAFLSTPAFNAPGSLVFEGANGQYAILGLDGSVSRNGQPLYSIYMVVTPEGGPTVMVSLAWFTKAELVDFLDTAQPGMLVIGGIDILEAMREDDIASQLP